MIERLSLIERLWRLAALAILSGLVFPASGSAAAADAAADCDAQGLRTLIAPGRVLLLGEIHGGVEGPALVAAAACAAVARGLPVTVALEIPRGEGRRITAFLASGGRSADRDALLAGGFWTRTFQDGRSSTAMADLLEALRVLRRRGRVEVALLDTDDPRLGGQARDDSMARELVAAVEHAGDAGLVLTMAGNFHTRTAVGLPFDAAYRPAGLAAAERWPLRVVAISLEAPPGRTWMCQTPDPASCQAQAVGGLTEGDAGALTLYPRPRDGYDGALRLAARSPSPPAVRPVPQARP